MKDSDKIGQFNATDVKINNKSFDNNIYMEEMKTQKINNSKILKRNKSKDVSDKKTKKRAKTNMLIKILNNYFYLLIY